MQLIALPTQPLMPGIRWTTGYGSSRLNPHAGWCPHRLDDSATSAGRPSVSPTVGVVLAMVGQRFAAALLIGSAEDTSPERRKRLRHLTISVCRRAILAVHILIPAIDRPCCS